CINHDAHGPGPTRCTGENRSNEGSGRDCGIQHAPAAPRLPGYLRDQAEPQPPGRGPPDRAALGFRERSHDRRMPKAVQAKRVPSLNFGRSNAFYCIAVNSQEQPMDAQAPSRGVAKVERGVPAKADNQEPSGKSSHVRPDPPPEAKPKATWKASLRQRPWLVAAIVAGILAAIVLGLLWWLHARQYETTDDAFIDARTVSISSQVAGAISELDVTDNQVVAADTVLAKLDDATYQAQLEQAKAQVEQAQANIANLDAQLDSQASRIDQAGKQVTEAQGALDFSQQEYKRYTDLVRTGAGTEQRAQQASSDLTQKQAALAAAQANAVTVQKQLAVLKTQRHAADAQLRSAEAGQKLSATNLSYTEIKAPVAGRVTQLTGTRGTYLQPGQSIMMFVPNKIWITANFKETQLDLMRP